MNLSVEGNPGIWIAAIIALSLALVVLLVVVASKVTTALVSFREDWANTYKPEILAPRDAAPKAPEESVSENESEEKSKEG